MILNGERPRAAPDEGNDQDNHHTHTLDSNHDQHDHQRNATRTKTETICKMGKRKRKQVIVDYFSLIVRTKSSTKSVRFESRGLPACRMENVCFFCGH